MPRIVNYAKKKNCLSKRVMCLALFPRWSSACWPRPLPDCEIFSKSALGLNFSTPPVTTDHLVSWGSLRASTNLKDPNILSPFVGRQFPGEIWTGDVLCTQYWAWKTNRRVYRFFIAMIMLCNKQHHSLRNISKLFCSQVSWKLLQAWQVPAGLACASWCVG